MNKRRVPSPAAPPPASLASLGELLAERGIRPGAAAVTPPGGEERASAPDAAALPDLHACGKLVVRRERKGHGGKTATVVAGLGMRAADLERLVRALRRALGCGASVDDDRIVVQGDQTERVQAWLTRHGARRVVLGN